MKGKGKRWVADPLAVVISRRTTMTAVTLVGYLSLFGMFDGAQAALTICNKTGAALDVAIAWAVRDAPGTSTGGHHGATAKGWWQLAPNGCKRVSSLVASDYSLFFLTKSAAGRTAGRAFLCVQDNAFTLRQQFRRAGDRCPADQYLAGFKSFDATAPNYTLSLTR